HVLLRPGREEDGRHPRPPRGVGPAARPRRGQGGDVPRAPAVRRRGRSPRERFLRARRPLRVEARHPGAARVTRQRGALAVFLCKRPPSTATWAAALVVVGLAAAFQPRLVLLAGLGAAFAVTWSVVSLLVSLYVYDCSELVSGSWVPRLLDPGTRTWATVHAGLDAEVELDAVMPGRCVARLDIFDPRVMTSSSISRARATTALTKEASRCDPTALALGD